MGISFKRPEAEIKKAIIQYLKSRGCLVIPYRNVGIKTRNKGWIRVKRKGIADLLGLTREGKFFAIEVKQLGGDRTVEQVAFLKTVRSYGCIGCFAESLEDVINQGL